MLPQLCLLAQRLYTGTGPLQECGSNPVEEYYEALRERGKSKYNAECLCRPVKQFSDFLNGLEKTLLESEGPDVEKWLTHLAAMGRCDRTRKAKLALVHVFYQWLIKMKITDFDPTAFTCDRRVAGADLGF